MPIPVSAVVGKQALSDGVVGVPRMLREGSLGVSEVMPRYYELARNGDLYMAHAIVTAPVIFSTAAGTGGPLIWNSTPDKNVVLLAVSFGVSVVTTVAASLGITGATGQTAAPTTATAIDSNANLKIGGALPASKAYRLGTVAVAGSFFLPFAHLHTGALTVDTVGVQWIDLGGAVVVPPGSWASVAASATASTTVAQIGLIYTEVPI